MMYLGVFRNDTVEHLSRQQISLKGSTIDVPLGSKCAPDCFPKDISLTYVSDLLYSLESENIYLDSENRDLLGNYKR